MIAQHWEWLNHKPTGNLTYNVLFINSTTGFVIGDLGMILRKPDGEGITQQKNHL